MSKLKYLILISTHLMMAQTWNTVGSLIGDSVLTSDVLNLNLISQMKMDKHNFPVIVYVDNNKKVWVKKFVYPNWITIGSPTNFTNNIVSDVDLAIDSQNNYYIVYSDWGSVPEKKPVIKKYNGSSWETLGNDFAYFEGTIKNDIEISSNDVLHFAFASTARKLSLVTYSSNIWQNIGPPNYGMGVAEMAEFVLKLSSSGIPYVYYVENGGTGFGGNGILQNGCYLLKATHNNWEMLGGGIVMGNSLGYPDLELWNEIPVIVFNDGNDGKTIKAIQFVNGAWSFFGGRLGGSGNAWSPGKNKVKMHNNELYALHRGVAAYTQDLRKYNSVTNQWDLLSTFTPAVSHYISNVGNLSLEFNSSGNPFIAYNTIQDKYVSNFYGNQNVLSTDTVNTTGYNLTVFPNPISNKIQIQNHENLLIKSYSISDINGRVLISKPCDLSMKDIDVMILTKGIYTLQLETEKGLVSRKIIKN